MGLTGCTSTAALELAVIVAEHTELLHFTAFTFFIAHFTPDRRFTFF